MSEHRPRIGVTMGDPGGIGPEIIVSSYDTVQDAARLIVLGDSDVLSAAIEINGVDLDLNPVDKVGEAAYEPGTLDVLEFDNVDTVEFGATRAEYGRASIEYVQRAIDLALAGEIDGMANAPLHKEAMKLAGSEYAGHTNMLADRTETDRDEIAMFVIADEFVVSHVTGHVPLRDVFELVTERRVADTIRTTERGMADLGIGDPTIAVTGLNPHAGDGGVLGTEDQESIAPGIEAAKEDGIDVHGPFPADSIFNQAIAGHFDAVVAMYHDQGHTPTFVQGYVDGGGVSSTSMTVGLPFPRTTTLHGTAHGIAGEQIATSESMINTIETAAKAVRNR